MQSLPVSVSSESMPFTKFAEKLYKTGSMFMVHIYAVYQYDILLQWGWYGERELLEETPVTMSIGPAKTLLTALGMNPVHRV